MAVFMSCGGNGDGQKKDSQKTEKEDPDSMIYGLACDGTNDSTVVLLKFSGEDPISFNVIDAKAAGKIIGQLQIGDWIGVMINPQDSTEATAVIDLDQLKGTWTYQVFPVWKDAQNMSKRALKRKLNEIPDSLREAYLVPREYGFTLKRSSKASPVGFVMRKSSLEDDSPVEYPAVKNYTGWKCRNGRLILISSNKKMSDEDKKDEKLVYDTLDFVSMTADSLVLTRGGKIYQFHRQANAMTANAAAQKAAEKTSSTDNKISK